MNKKAYASRHSKVIPFPQRNGSPYPNAAQPGYFMNKVLDCALAAATSLGTVAILMFLIILG